MSWNSVLSTALAVVAVTAPQLSPAQGAGPSATGHWEGELVQQGQSVPIRFDLASEPSAQSRFSVDRWRVMDYPIGPIAVKGAHVSFSLGDSEAFEGELMGGALAGSFKGDDGQGTFRLRRTARPRLPYEEIAVSFRNGDVLLSGTLAAPLTPGRHPAVVMVHGSGPEVRWGTNRYIADRFARAGIAALVYDKRGTGESGGDWRTASYEDLARDALAGVALLSARADVDPDRIGIHGHSEGGIVAPIAESLALDRVAFIVAEGTVAGRIRDQDLFRVTGDIAARDWTRSDKEKALELYRLFLDAASGDRPYSDFGAAGAAVNNQAWFKYLGLPPKDHWLWAWYRQKGDFDTLTVWRGLKRPALLIYGERDKIAPAGESIRNLEDALDMAGAPYAAFIVPRAEHNLTIHPAPGEPFFWWRQAPGVIDMVVYWIKECSSPGGPCSTRAVR